MKTLHRHNNNGRSKGRTLLIAISLAALLLFGADKLSGGFPRSVAQGAAASVWGMTANASRAVAASGLLHSRQSLAEENIALRQKIAALEVLALTNEALVEENDSLRTLVGVAESIDRSQTFSVLSYVNASPYSSFIISGGSAEGVVAGSLVLAEGGVLIGTIEHVGIHTSQVHSVFAPERTVTGRIGDNTALAVHGRGGGNSIARIPRDVVVEEGDLVYYEAGNLIIGEVGAVSASSADAEKTLFIRVPLNLYSVRFVTVTPAL